MILTASYGMLLLVCVEDLITEKYSGDDVSWRGRVKAALGSELDGVTSAVSISKQNKTKKKLENSKLTNWFSYFLHQPMMKNDANAHLVNLTRSACYRVNVRFRLITQSTLNNEENSPFNSPARKWQVLTTGNSRMQRNFAEYNLKLIQIKSINQINTITCNKLKLTKPI